MSDWTPHADAVVRAAPEDEATQAARDKLEQRYRALIERLREAGDETWANNLAGHNSFRSEPAKCSLAVLEMMVEEIHQLRHRPRGTPMPDQFRETAGNLNTADDVQDKLTAAEQAVARLLLYEEGSEWAVDTERHIELARAVVPVVRPIIEAEVLFDAAEHCGHTQCLKRVAWVEEWGSDWPACPTCYARAGEPCRDRRTGNRTKYTRRPHPGRGETTT